MLIVCNLWGWLYKYKHASVFVMKENSLFEIFLNSCDQLLEASKLPPISKDKYTVRKYCKIPLGESKEDKEYVELKPKHVVQVDWKYEELDNPLPVKITFVTESESNNVDGTRILWEPHRLQKWLRTNTRKS